MVDTFHIDCERSFKAYQVLSFLYRRMLNQNWGVHYEFDFETYFGPVYGEGSQFRFRQ